MAYGAVSDEVPTANGCELCEAARFTHWYWEDEICWVADCEVCATPMVVWTSHGTEPADHDVEHMIERLVVAATECFGADGFEIDRTMRQIPDHFHAHARDPHWRRRRLREPASTYRGVGVARFEP